MAKLQRVMNYDRSPHGVQFKCPGCGHVHTMPTVMGQRPSWEFNGDYDRPTLQPSILFRTKDYDWDEKKQEATNVRDVVCHSFVTDGKIQFLGDCTHALAGVTVDLPDVAEEKAQ